MELPIATTDYYLTISNAVSWADTVLIEMIYVEVALATTFADFQGDTFAATNVYADIIRDEFVTVFEDTDGFSGSETFVVNQVSSDGDVTIELFAIGEDTF